MSYQLKRIDPYWHSHPMIPTVAVIGGIVALVGVRFQQVYVAGAGLALAGLCIFLATRPAISCVTAVVGLCLGALTFLVVPDLNAASMSLPLRGFSTMVFMLIYMLLMDAVALVVAVLYNFFAGGLGLGGVRLELEGVEEGEEAA